MAQIKLTSVPFNGTPEQEAKLRAGLQPLKGIDGPLMPALQLAQEIYGYLPIEVQKIVAEEMGVSLEKIFGISTFYAQFTLNPKGKYEVAVCLGTACYVKGSGDIYDELQRQLGIGGGECTPDREFSLTATRCIGCCGLAPVLTVNGDVYGKLVTKDVAGIIAKYKA
ncbi:MAG: NAD(P)H-dependent oxidoreductase subunit E [Clostridia bacterium]|nr:NAD(P)H-dependent oxidoreductase subunit E [Clostridia bacterium]